ncbi:MAG: hypothetical protein HY700_21555 [Gemmatimonadetes bacterium]|nr:hypothetical protein [Gemmatimonadota bacterium]
MKQLFRIVLLAGITGVAGACGDREVATAPDTSLPATQLLITCLATVSARSVTCNSPRAQAPRGMPLSVMLGGQGTYVQVNSSGTAYSGGTFSSNVTIQNLTAQPMGTSDGTNADAAGIRVFFHSGPTVTGGTGAVAVANADGQGSFTGTNQPYFQYAGPLAPGATSASKTWQWTVPNTVSTFAFTVLVSTTLPDDGGVLHWINQTGSASADLGEVSAANNEIWAVGSGATILHYNGTGWSTQASPVSGVTLRGIEMYSGTPVTGFAVGDNSTILRYDGTNWNTVTFSPSGGSTYTTLCRIDANVIYLVGAGGTIEHSTDNGAHFTQEPPPAGGMTDYFTCGGPNPGDVYVSGLNGVILHSTGSGLWTRQTSNTTNALRAMQWFGNGSGGLSEIWLTGGSLGAPGVLLHSTGDGTWTPAGTTAQPIRGLRATGPNDIYGVGASGFVIHYNGLSWSTQASGTTAQLNHMAPCLLGDGHREWWVVGNAGMILLGTR